MLQWISANIGTILICLVLLVLVGLVVRYLIHQKKQGKSSCGCNCAHCAMHGTCHSHKMVKTILEIDGMACGMCESHVNDAIRKAFEVKKVTSSHTKGRTEILSEQPLEENKLKAAIEATGYHVTAIQSESYEKKGFSLFRK